MTKQLKEKLNRLHGVIGEYPRFAIAFSGGVDSTFLVAVAFSIRQDVVALTVESPFLPASERAYALNVGRTIGIRHEIVSVNLLDETKIVGNTKERCYYCKKIIFDALKKRAGALGMNCLAHGVNVDDLLEIRPGLRAADEMGVLAPLVTAQMTKQDIRTASKIMGLESWNNPSQSCLATRIPYGVPISIEDLNRIDQCESFLSQLGISGGRVRCHGETARIEVPSHMISIVAKEELRDRITSFFKERHFKYVTLDLEGYRFGKME